MSLVPILARSIIRGKAITPSGSGLYTLPTTANLELWLNAQTGVITDGSGVATWQDQSPSGRIVSRLDGNYTVAANAVNGFSALETTTDASLSFAGYTVTESTLLVCAKVFGDTQVLTGGATNRQMRLARLDNLTTITWADGTERIGTLPVATNVDFAIYEWVRNSVPQISFFQNGASAGTFSANAASTSWSTIGRVLTIRDANWQVTDIIHYSAALSAGDRATIRATLGSRYGITVA